MTKPLSLSDHGLAQVRRAARTLPPAERGGFLEALARRLGEQPSDAAIEQAIAVVLGSMTACSMPWSPGRP
jgi:hypothetical protein